ncbi:uncharacterized protein LOC121580321 [Coregonus clupeaformis]|uniref:uncharacterized protein LOC121580321 n=1 Tax=Coregonus clupeaformis TaxID=59861 RepID=UPI001E1C9D8C|nr:uncharacterized protein LOC121580321 [Coregonus clupeaformis]
MLVVFGLLVMLTGLANGMKEKSCDARQNMSCHGILGETVYLQLMNNATGSELKFKKVRTSVIIEIFKKKNNTVIIHDSIKARSEFFINNGTFRIANTEWNDSGEYLLEIYNSSGIYLSTRRVQLIIGGRSDWPIIASLVAVVLVLTVVVGAYCIHKRGTPPQAPVPTDADESPELEYADVTILKKMDKPPEVPEEVKYGQVVVLEGPRQTKERDRPETIVSVLVTDDMGYDELKSPVSSPQLSSECLSHGEMRVSCSSEGNGPQYSRTLDGHTVRDTEASSDNETNTITLKKGLSGDLTCIIRNNISSVAVSKRISHCPV